MKNVMENLLGFIYSFSMGDYFFFVGTFLLIVLFIYVLYLIKLSELEEKKEEISNNNISDTFDIEAVTKAIEEDYKPETVRLTSYEIEQEQSAIISYDELLNNKDKVGINYDDEYTYDIPELSVKKINLTTDPQKQDESPRLEVKLMQYDKEEAFLKALKELQENLSH